MSGGDHPSCNTYDGRNSTSGTAMSISRFAYTDESGNTGLNLFDEAQPTFWTGTLVAYADIDQRYGRYHKELLAITGRAEIHGAELGMHGIEKIADRILCLAKEKKLHFLFSRVDKGYLAAAKMFDLVFDSGTNMAMPTHAYAIQQLRLINNLHFVQMLEGDDLKDFWDIFRKQDSQRFGLLLARVRERLSSFPYDDRSKQIIGDVLEWGARNPAEILDPYGERDSPNFVAFIGLFDHLHSLNVEHGHRVASFVHDEQNQFMKVFKEAYKLVSKIRHKTGPFTVISDIEKMDSFDADLIVRSSHESFGLQLVDVCLWLVKRVIDKDEAPSGQCERLVDWLICNNFLVRFDFGQVANSVKVGAQEVYRLPFSSEDEMNAKRLRQSFEEARLKRMNGLLEA